MTELLPNGDKVEMILADNEVVTVPDGKVWVVTVHSAGGITTVQTSGNNTFGKYDSSGGNKPAQGKITVHEGNVIDSGSGFSGITGWEFDYSQ